MGECIYFNFNESFFTVLSMFKCVLNRMCHLVRLRRDGKVSLLLFFMFVGFLSNAQVHIGGTQTPLQYSTHTFSITMGNGANDVSWAIYDDGVTRPQIESGTATAHVSPTAYSIVGTPTKSAGVASITIRFDGNLLLHTTYQLFYIEKSSDQCLAFVPLEFVIQDPIDIDIDPDDLVRDLYFCPDSAENFIEGNGTLVVPVTKTTVVYHIAITDPSGTDTSYVPEPANATNTTWGFNYQITVTGQSGASAIISEINFNPAMATVTPGTSVYNGSATFQNSVIDYEVLVTYNDIPGVQQRVDFNLTQIHGSYLEIDVDVKTGQTGENELTHYFNSMPAPSYIGALD